MEDSCFLDSLDPELYSHSTQMSQAKDDDNNALKILHEKAQTLYQKVQDGRKESLPLLPWARVYRVPENLRRLNKRAYTPHVIAIGPLHRKEKLLQPMQKVKMYYTSELLSRVRPTNENVRTDLGVLPGQEKEKEKEKEKEVLRECMKTMSMKEFVAKVKEFYAAEVTVKDDEMLEMMLVDGCFILELLYVFYHEKKRVAENGGESGCSKELTNGGEDTSTSKEERKRPIFGDSLTFNLVRHDLVLLENQIPFFVLDELFKLTLDQIPTKTGETKPSLRDYIWYSFYDFIRFTNNEGKNNGSKKNSSCGWPSCAISVPCPTKELENSNGENIHSEMKTTRRSSCDCVLWVCGSAKETKQGKTESGKSSPNHLLHLLHDHYLPPEERSEYFTDLQVSASDLDYAGVKFVGKESNDNHIFDITFKNRKGIRWWFRRAEFQIPSIDIYDHTEAFLRNLIALEQCSPGVPHHFTSYAVLMDSLITSEKDVKVLKNAKVIRNHLGADVDVCHLFNKLCKEIGVRDFFFENQCQDAYKYSQQHWWPKYMAHLTRTYSACPWKFIAVCVAIIVFIVTVTNFVRSFLK